MAVHFVDEARVFIKAGDGGSGCIGYAATRGDPRRRRPNGGMGGDGGDVLVVGNAHLSSLLDFKYQKHFEAERGERGGTNNRYGRRGNDLVIEVPLGTVITAESGETWEVTQPQEPLLLAAGGKGGRGNNGLGPRQVAVVHRGETAEGAWYQLELKLFADVGVIGLPNAGKSSLVRRLSGAKPKVADYPFTTLTPTLGVVELADGRRFTIADIPGLVEGAHRGVGLGNRFLRHISRVRCLAHMIDIGPVLSATSPADKIVELYDIIRQELARHDQALLERPEIVLLNKIDLCTTPRQLDDLLAALRRLPVEVLALSVNSGEGVEQALGRLDELQVAGR